MNTIRRRIMFTASLIAFLVGILASYFVMKINIRQEIFDRFPNTFLYNVRYINRDLELEDFYGISMDITHDELMSKIGWPNAIYGSGIVRYIYLVDDGVVVITWLGRPIIEFFSDDNETIYIPVIEVEG
ncbi:MAG: hypothetical protein J6A59_14675 [Lachnospiraceae bacterium]|nr:hypothetical protein [Lachnospiraceae bacterium]